MLLPKQTEVLLSNTLWFIFSKYIAQTKLQENINFEVTRLPIASAYIDQLILIYTADQLFHSVRSDINYYLQKITYFYIFLIFFSIRN